jgi:hypothetical protein
VICDIALQIPLEQAHEHLTETATLTPIIRHDHFHVHAGGLNSIPTQRGSRGFLGLWLHAYVRASFMLGAGDPAMNDVFLAAVVTYLEQLSSWEERFGTWQGRSEADRLAYAMFFGLEAPKGEEREALLEALLEIMGYSEAATWVNP